MFSDKFSGVSAARIRWLQGEIGRKVAVVSFKQDLLATT